MFPKGLVRSEREGNKDSFLVDAQRLHASVPVADIHSDIPTDIYRRRERGERDILGNVHLPKLRAGGVSICGMAVNNDSFVGGLQADAALRRVINMIEAVEEEVANAPEFRMARTVAEMTAAVKEGRIAVPLGLEGGACIGESIATIRALYRLGIRSIVLTWNYRNGIGDGIAEEGRGGGLSRFGVLAVKEMQRLGIVVDVSHLTQVGVDQVLDVAERPIIASHSNARTLCDHPRNLNDQKIEAIARMGGLVGVCFYPGFVDVAAPSLDRVLDHIDYLVQLVGDEHVAFGPDFVDYMSDFLNEKLQQANVGYLNSSEYPIGISGVHELHNVTAGLLARGYTDVSITKILGENYLRVCNLAMN